MTVAAPSPHKVTFERKTTLRRIRYLPAGIKTVPPASGKASIASCMPEVVDDLDAKLLALRMELFVIMDGSPSLVGWCFS
jgi:hypothetical protein